MTDYTLLTIKIAAYDPNAALEGNDEPPTITAYVDTSDGDPIIREVNLTGARGASVTQPWGGLDWLDQLVAALPKQGTALQPIEPATAEARVIEPAVAEPEQHYKRRECPRCHRDVAVHPATGALIKHYDKVKNGKPCPKGTAQSGGSVKGKKRGLYRNAPDNVLELLEREYRGSPSALARGLGVPTFTAAGWIRRARRRQGQKARVRDNVRSLPVHDPSDFNDLADPDTGGPYTPEETS